MNWSQQLIRYITGPGSDNTPVFIYVLAYFGAAMVYYRTNPRRINNISVYFKMLIINLLLQVFCFITSDYYERLYFLNVILYFASICAMLHVSCDMNLRNVVYYSVRAYILGEMAASLVWQLIYFYADKTHVEPDRAVQALILLVLLVCVFMAAYAVERYINRAQEHIHIERQEVVISLIIFICIYALSNISYSGIQTPFSTSHVGDRYIIRTLADMAGVSILLVYHVQIRASHTRIEKAQLDSLYKMQYANYQVSRESIELVNQKYHDLKHQIATLRAQVAQDNCLTFADNIEKDINQFEAQNKTGNSILDTILTAKSLQCHNENIRMTCIADGKLLDIMEPMDISSLFGNALDNAITSVEQIADPEKRIIHVTVSREKNFLRIKFENCYMGNIIMKNGMPVTTKSDRRYHGFGLKSIRSIADKYNGSLTINAKDSWFELRVLIPLQ